MTGGARIAALATAVGLVAGAALRIDALGSAYWFDELWSTRLALTASGVAEIYAHAHDNNHLLNTVVLHWIGPRDGWLAYRVLPFACGIALLVLAVFEPGRSASSRAMRALLLGASPVLVLLSTEARGYAPALAAALGAWLLLRRRLEGGGLVTLVAFETLLILGLASHLIFVHVWVASFVCAAWSLRERGASPAAAVRELAALFAVPAVVAAAHAFAFVAPMQIGGGPAYGAAGFALRVARFALGMPDAAAAVVVAGCLAVAALAAHLRDGWRARDPRWVFDATILLVSPVVLPLVLSPGVVAVRYFALQILFLLLALADRAADAIGRGGAMRLAAVTGVLLVLLSNTSLHRAFALDGRGRYVEALRHVAAVDPGADPVRIAGDHDSRVGLMVDFYARQVDRPIRYVGRATARDDPPDWLIVHGLERDAVPPADVGVHGADYRLERSYGFAYLSGFRWDVYRRLTSPRME